MENPKRICNRLLSRLFCRHHLGWPRMHSDGRVWQRCVECGMEFPSRLVLDLPAPHPCAVETEAEQLERMVGLRPKRTKASK